MGKQEFARIRLARQSIRYFHATVLKCTTFFITKQELRYQGLDKSYVLREIRKGMKKTWFEEQIDNFY